MNVQLGQGTRQVTTLGKFIGCGADDNSPYTQEPDEVKVSCPVLNRRWGGQPPHRPELACLMRNLSNTVNINPAKNMRDFRKIAV